MKEIQRILCLFLFLYIFELSSLKCSGASAHIRVNHHQQQQKQKNHERLEDGAFTSRDSDHYSSNGDHHNAFDHEVILGSVKEAEEYDKLPATESKRRLRILLQKMDLNTDEFIERNELKAWILRSFSMLTEEESRDRFEDTDSNEDQKITWEEILNDTYGSDPEDLIAIDEKLVNEDKETFEISDLNKDGYLDAEEFRAYSHPEETPRMYPFLVRQALKEKDIDKDNYLNFQEFLGGKAQNENKEWLLVEKTKFDHEYDKNGDGRLDISEILSWLVPSNEEIATDEVDHLFAASDDDHDNRLSFDEVLEHHDVFVGSEATDYGDHLQDIERFTDEL